MKASIWPRDTIALRFAVTTGLAIGVSAAFMALFFIFGGTWAQPDAESSGLLETAASIVHIADAVPPEVRRTVAVTASTDRFRVDWYGADTPTVTALRSLPQPEIRALSHGQIPRRLIPDHEDFEAGRSCLDSPRNR